jgi:DNA-directed RNA polymerase I subunit RPA12
VETWAETAEACPKCGAGRVLYREMQLRGADEGATVFFRCRGCKNRYVVLGGEWVREGLTRCRWKLDN